MSRFSRHLYWNYRVISAARHWITRRFTPLAGLLFSALVATGFLGADTSLSVAYQAFAFVLGLFLMALASSWFYRGRFRIYRYLPRLASVGVPLAYDVVLENQTRRRQHGLWVMEDLEDSRPTLKEFAEIPEPDEQRRNWLDRRYGYYRWAWLSAQKQRGTVAARLASPIPPHGRAEIRMELVPLKRGVLRFEGATVACPDPFGIFRAWMKVSLAQSILILPKRYVLPPIDLSGTRKYQPRGVALASSVGESEEFMSLREYRPGDPLRHIHWRSWAKVGKPIVKEFEDEYFVRHALILDTFTDRAFSALFEEAVSVAASLACTLPTQDSLLDLLFVGPKAYCFTAGRGLAHTEQLMEILAAVDVCRDQTFQSLSRLVLNHIGAVSGCLCVLLAWDQERQDFVAALKALEVPLRVLVVTEPGITLDPGPLRDRPEWFITLEMGRIAESLAQL
jgi:uncharacterized protein (DUF58 family)